MRSQRGGLVHKRAPAVMGTCQPRSPSRSEGNTADQMPTPGFTPTHGVVLSRGPCRWSGNGQAQAMACWSWPEPAPLLRILAAGGLVSPGWNNRP